MNFSYFNENKTFNSGSDENYSFTPKTKTYQQQTGSQESVIRTKIVKDAINKMQIAGCFYKIVMPDGTFYEHDPNGVFEQKPTIKKRNFRYQHGELRKYYEPFVQNMVAGDLVCVPYGKYDPKNLVGSLSAWASANWGNEAHTLARNVKNKTVEILRLK
jgi:hypothetical protein